MAQGDSRLVKVGLIGTVVAALCCFTPLLVVLLGAVGLGAVTGYLDYVLLPALIVFGAILAYGLWRRRGRGSSEEKS
jgi:mercuric ion transport protein